MILVGYSTGLWRFSLYLDTSPTILWGVGCITLNQLVIIPFAFLASLCRDDVLNVWFDVKATERENLCDYRFICLLVSLYFSACINSQKMWDVGAKPDLLHSGQQRLICEVIALCHWPEVFYSYKIGSFFILVIIMLLSRSVHGTGGNSKLQLPLFMGS